MKNPEQPTSSSLYEETLKTRLSLPESATNEEVRKAIFEQMRNSEMVKKDPEFQEMALEIYRPILDIFDKWVRDVFEHIENTCERDNCSASEARRRLKIASDITMGHKFSERRLAEKIAKGENYNEILEYVKGTYSIENVRKWLKEDSDVQELHGNMDWF